MKFVNLDESEIIEQPLEKVIARPDYSPVEFVYDDLCSLDSVSVDGIHPSGDDSDLILPPSVNKINSCFKSEYFKISNLFSEIQTYEQKQEALKNLGLLDAINNSSYIHDLGRFDKQVDVEEAAVKVANNSNVVIMLYYIGSQNGIIFQQVGDTITKQILLWDNTIFQRHVNFSDSSKTQVSSISYWWKLGATHISYDPDTRKFHLQDMNYKNLNPAVDSEVPLASSTKDGFMSKEQARKLGTTLVKNDITNNLTTSSSTKVLSAQMGKTLKTEIDKLQQLAIKDLGTDLQPHIATGNIITYVKDNNIKETVLFKYIDTDGSSTLGVCISRINDIGWIIYLVARKGIERLVFNSNGVREEWNEYGGVLRHNLDSVADEQLECLSVKGVKSLLSTKQDALSPGDGITMMNNTVSTLIGNGLTYNGREIVIDHDLTLKTNNGKLGVNAGDGLYVNPDNELGINIGKGLAINHTDSTVEVAEEVLNDITIKSGTGTNSSLQINAPGSKASGTNSLAVGMDAVASGDYSIAMGRGCSATGRGSVALGGVIISIKLTGDKGAIRYQSSIDPIIAEYLSGFNLVKTSNLTTPVATITASEVIDNVVYITVDKTLSNSSALSNTTFGLIGNKASGVGSIALGASLLSSNQNSIAEGWVTVAAGSYSHAEGSFNITKGNSSHAEGGFNIAEGIRSHAEGYYTVAKAASSHAEGARSLASGDASHAEGYGTVASGDYSHAEGSGIYNIYLTGSNSTYQISYGGNVQNTFHFIRRCQGASIIEYTNFTKIATITSVNISDDGYTVTITTDVDLGELSNYKCGVAVNIASGQSSHTENAAQASGKESHAGGWSLSTNECSFSHGYDCVADGEVSTSFGTNTYSQNNSEFALGRSNHSHTGETLAEQTLFSVGCGDFEQIDMSKRIEQQLPLPTPEDGTNALEIMQNGDIWLGGYEEGVKLFEGETKELNTYTKEELDVELNSKIESTKNELSTSIDSKAPLEGYAPNLKVRFSDGLVGRIETIPHEIGKIAPTAGISVDDNSATIEKIKGESVVWNQIIRLTNSDVQYDKELYSITLLGGTIAVTKSEGGTWNRDTIYANFTHNFVALRKYLLIYNLRRSDKQNTVHSFDGAGIYDGTKYHDLIKTSGTDYKFFSPTESFTSRLMQITQNVTQGVALSYTLKPVIYDLTQMFGAGNEPTTIEEFEARRPLNVTDDYNEGTIVSFQGGDIKSVGFNAFTAKNSEAGSINTTTGLNTPFPTSKRSDFLPCIGNVQYEFIKVLHLYEYDTNRNFIKHTYLGNVTDQPINKIITLHDKTHYIRVVYPTGNESSVCIHLIHSGYRNGDYESYIDDIHPLPNVKSVKDNNGDVLFPYGLLSAGSVYDEITATKAIKRIGVVDMGTLTWFISETTTPDKSSTYNFLYTTKTVSPIGQALKAVALNPKYIWVETKALNVRELSDKTFMFSGGSLYLRDNYYTSAPDFKQAMQGVLLYYELAEPIEVDLLEPLNMTYDAWDFGTEELVVSEPSTSLKGEIIYHFNAVDRIRENSRAIETLKEHVEERKDDGIELLTNGNLKLTLKGETREFMPATPSGDPMHYAYIAAGAEWNDTENIIKKTPIWKTEEFWQKEEDGTYTYWEEDVTVDHLSKHWYLNGIGDIANDEMREIYNNGRLYVGNDISNLYNTKARTALLSRKSGAEGTGFDLYYLCGNSSYIETLVLTNNNLAYASNIHCMFTNTRRIVRIFPAISINTSTVGYFSGSFKSAKTLKECELQKIVLSVSYADCPLIYKRSILGAINTCNPKSAITITLHPDAYVRMVNQPDIIAALEAKNAALAGTGGSISLVSA